MDTCSKKIRSANIFFSIKQRGEDFFRKQIRELFHQSILKDLKKDHFRCQKVNSVGSSDNRFILKQRKTLGLIFKFLSTTEDGSSFRRSV